MGRVSGGAAEARLQRRRRGAAGRAVGRTGRSRPSSTRAASGRRCGGPSVSPDADDDLSTTRGAVGGAPALAVGHAGVLPRLQRASTAAARRNRICSRGCDEHDGGARSAQTAQAPLDMQPGEFREIGHRLVDQIADRLAKLPDGPVTPDESPAELRRAIGAEQSLPGCRHRRRRGWSARRPGCCSTTRCSTGIRASSATSRRAPRRSGCSATSWPPRSTRTSARGGCRRSRPRSKAQTVRWIAELIGFPASCGGLLVSGGNMANFVCFLAARAAKAPWDVRTEGLSRQERQLLVYASTETHTWIQKAADLFGLGTDAIRWIAADDEQRMDPVGARAVRLSRISGSAISRSSSSARPARSAPARSIRWRRSPPSAAT